MNSAVTTHMQAVSPAEGLAALRELLLSSKSKKLRKDPTEIRLMVDRQLNKLAARAAELNAAKDPEGAGKCMAAYYQLFSIYKQQFVPLMDKLGVKGAADLVLQVGSPLSEITPELWQQLSSMASGGEYASLLSKLAPILPKPRPGQAKAAKGGGKRKAASKSSESDPSSSSDGGSKASSQDSKRHKSKHESMAEVAKGVGRAIGQGIQQALAQAQAFGGRGRGYGRGYGRGGGRGGGRSPGGKGDRGPRK